MDAAKEALLTRFRAYLEAADTMEPSVQAAAPDLFTLLAELAALKNEVKIESRQVKGALEQFKELFDTLHQANERLGAELDRRRREEHQAVLAAERDLLLELIDLRDRLHSGHAHAADYRPGWLARRGGADGFVARMAEGLAMNLRRLDEILARRDVRPVEALGRPFDPHLMTTVEVTSDPERPSGEVVAQLRPGWLRGGEALRPAEVVVNKHEDQAT